MVRKPRRVTAAAAALGAAVSYHLPPRVSSAAPVDAAGTDGGHGTRDRRRLCGGLGWHASQPVNDGCSDDANYQESWTRPGLIDNFFHDTVEECCAFFFRGGRARSTPRRARRRSRRRRGPPRPRRRGRPRRAGGTGRRDPAEPTASTPTCPSRTAARTTTTTTPGGSTWTTSSTRRAGGAASTSAPSWDGRAAP